jgi:hypothetical protein
MMRSFIAVLALIWAASGAVAQSPLEAHIGHRLEGSGEWRTPNPDYNEADPDSPSEYGVNFHWGPGRAHVEGELVGITADGRQAYYWTILIVHNPVTDRVITQQIGSDGAYGVGDSPTRAEALRPGEVETVDMMFHGANGQVRYVRHESVFPEPGLEQTNVYERDATGAWVRQRAWTWRRVPVGGVSP